MSVLTSLIHFPPPLTPSYQPRRTHLLFPELLDHLSPILFEIPAEPPTLSLSTQELVSSMWPPWYTDCANYLRILLTLDEGNRTGIRDQAAVGRVMVDWLDPLERKVGGMKQEIGEKGMGVEVGFVLDRWEDAVLRAREAVDKYKV